MPNEIRLPNSRQRIAIMGRTGTGKTVAGLWHLSNFPLDRQAWILFNFKGDEHINSIPNQREIDYSYVPKRKDAGVFVINSMPMDAQREKPTLPSPVELYIWKLWERENVGIMCDEGYMMANNNAFETVLTQGRSKKMPMIVCAQRPAWLSRFVFSEADFFQIFHLNDVRDQKTIEGFVPLDYSKEQALKEHQSFYFDVGKNLLKKFNPVPNMDEIREVFESKMKRRTIFI